MFALIVVFFGILYLIFLKSESKINISHYWKAGKTRISIDENTRQEFQNNEQKIKAYKHLLEIVVSSRNNVQKGLNELKILLKHFLKETHVDTDDLAILKNLGIEIHAMKNNLIQLKTEKSSFFSENIIIPIDSLIDILNNYTLCIYNIMDASQVTLKNPEFVSHEVQTIESNYKELVEIHSQLIKQFRTNFS